MTLRCALGTYSLSAHADEAELITIADALGAEEIMLVHGDPGARHSLATNLRQRQKHVQTPKIGQTISFSFGPRPWALGQIKGGAETRPLDPHELWETIKAQAGNFYSAGEIARMWWGEGDKARAQEVIRVLNAEPIYFAPDWRQQDLFRVNTAEQVGQAQRRRAIMLAHPDLVGQLIVLRDSNNRPRVGVVTAASADAFEARVHNAKGTHYPADALIWAIAPWRDFPVDQEAGRAKLSAIVQEARAFRIPAHAGTAAGVGYGEDKPVDPARLLPTRLPEGYHTRGGAAGAWCWHWRGMARAGRRRDWFRSAPCRANRWSKTRRASTALSLFPAEAQLRKVGMEVHRRRITLSFDFPDVARPAVRGTDRAGDRSDGLGSVRQSAGEPAGARSGDLRTAAAGHAYCQRAIVPHGPARSADRSGHAGRFYAR